MSAFKRYVVCGQSGAGKSTWVAERRQPGDLVFDWDDLMTTMFALPRGDKRKGAFDVLMALRDSLLAWLAVNDLWADVFLIVADEKQARTIATRIRGEVVVLDTPLEVCAERIAERRLQDA